MRKWFVLSVFVAAATFGLATLPSAAAQDQAPKVVVESEADDAPAPDGSVRHGGFVDPIERYWFPFKKRIKDRGISFGLNCSSDFFANARGGKNTEGAFQYRGLLDFGLTVETEPLGLWKGGTFFVNFINNHGVDISERYVGELQAVNNADAPNASRLYEYWYRQTLFDERVRLKFGKMDVNSDFAGGLYRDEFVHSSPGFSPTIPLITWPDPALGVALCVEPTEWLYVGGGIYDAEGTGTRGGFETAFHSPADSFTIFEAGVRPKPSLLGQKDLPGQYSVGGFYHGGEWPIYFNDLDGRRRPRFETGNSGVYVTLDQLVFREAGAEEGDTEQGLGLFFQFGWSPSDRNEISQHYGGGFQYCGPIPTRDDDVLGFGAHHVSLSDEVQTLEQRYSETAMEFFYKVQLTEWLSIKPDLQYIVNPGGDGRDALVAGGVSATLS